MSRIAKTAKRPGKYQRANGQASRERILNATAEIASERGYDGASIAQVSKRSGLPASSIYWHFKDKDRLIAAVIERSFNRWLDGIGAWVLPRRGVTRRERFTIALRQTARVLAEAPDFLRLGLMLALERRPTEASARRLFLQVREEAYRRTVVSYEAFFDELDKADVRALATLTIAAADGLFIAHEIDGDSLNLDAAFELLAQALLGAGEHLRTRSNRSRNKTRK
ncbi:MAG: TetR/AcrR family transcriptional regulator [Candidatus Binataceae bacterium]